MRFATWETHGRVQAGVLSSAGLHALEYVIERATEHAAGVSVVAPRDNVRHVLEIAGSPSVLDALR